jgi:ABC-type lipoprotein export system ATPase subunit
MLIQKFFAPLDDVADQGLKEINMSRLGRFVALAGKNGSGKSRILNKLETYIKSRQNTLSNLANIREGLKINQAALNSQPTSPIAKDWKTQIESFNLQLEIAFNRIISTEQKKTLRQ